MRFSARFSALSDSETYCTGRFIMRLSGTVPGTFTVQYTVQYSSVLYLVLYWTVPVLYCTVLYCTVPGTVRYFTVYCTVCTV
jgi:hypothetical protein